MGRSQYGRRGDGALPPLGPPPSRGGGGGPQGEEEGDCVENGGRAADEGTPRLVSPLLLLPLLAAVLSPAPPPLSLLPFLGVAA